MPTNIPGNSANYPANIIAPTAGDDRNAVSVATGLENLADRTAYLRSKSDALIAKTPGLATTYQQQIPLFNNFGAVSAFTFDSFSLLWTQSSTAGTGILRFAVDVPQFGVISGVHVVVCGAAIAPRANKPATMPRIKLVRKRHVIGAAAADAGSVLTDVSDSSASGAAYSLVHAISATGINATIQAGDTYYLNFDGETGANASDNQLQLLHAYLVITP